MGLAYAVLVLVLNGNIIRFCRRLVFFATDQLLLACIQYKLDGIFVLYTHPISIIVFYVRVYAKAGSRIDECNFFHDRLVINCFRCFKYVTRFYCKITIIVIDTCYKVISIFLKGENVFLFRGNIFYRTCQTLLDCRIFASGGNRIHCFSLPVRLILFNLRRLHAGFRLQFIDRPLQCPYMILCFI